MDGGQKKFVMELSGNLEKANELRDNLEKFKDSFDAKKDKLMQIVQPLNEINERSVQMPEIENVLKGLKSLSDDLG